MLSQNDLDDFLGKLNKRETTIKKLNILNYRYRPCCLKQIYL